MRNNRSVIWASIGVAIVMFALVFVQHVTAGSTAERTTYLTFRGAVRLPGVTLSPGTYVFELLDPFNAPGVVAVRSRDRRTSYFLGFTRTTERSRGLHLDTSVSMGESAAGVPPPITAWWPVGDLTGRQFIYPTR